MDNNKTDMATILDTTRNYEHISFLKSIAGLYYRAGMVFTLGYFGLLILQVLSSGDIFYDKGIAQFTVVLDLQIP